jgi:hypothetical protein
MSRVKIMLVLLLSLACTARALDLPDLQVHVNQLKAQSIPAGADVQLVNEPDTLLPAFMQAEHDQLWLLPTTLQAVGQYYLNVTTSRETDVFLLEVLPPQVSPQQCAVADLRVQVDLPASQTNGLSLQQQMSIMRVLNSVDARVSLDFKSLSGGQQGTI